jgi:hypothetical protein
MNRYVTNAVEFSDWLDRQFHAKEHRHMLHLVVGSGRKRFDELFALSSMKKIVIGGGVLTLKNPTCWAISKPSSRVSESVNGVEEYQSLGDFEGVGACE